MSILSKVQQIRTIHATNILHIVDADASTKIYIMSCNCQGSKNLSVYPTSQGKREMFKELNAHSFKICSMIYNNTCVRFMRSIE